MCTCLELKKNKNYFGRTLDLDFHYNEEVVVTPRNYQFKLKNGEEFNTTYAIYGTAIVFNNYPLYYEAANEKGLALAGLNFPVNNEYKNVEKGKLNLTPFELIPYFLGKYQSVKALKKDLENLNITNINFMENMPLSPLHFMVSDKDDCLVFEQTKEGLKIYQNKVGVMTNNPTFDDQLRNLENYQGLTNEFKAPESEKEMCVGLGAVGLPGDYSSKSRFVKTAFLKEHARITDDEVSNVTEFFHILDAVSMVKGSVLTKNNTEDVTFYTSCYSLDNNIYYYKTYTNNQISALKLTAELMNKKELTRMPLITEQQIKSLN